MTKFEKSDRVSAISIFLQPFVLFSRVPVVKLKSPYGSAEGNLIMEDQYISIDIFIPKLLEWLLSRRHCMYDWQAAVIAIRAKINEAIQDMPENKEITLLLSGTYINYFHCLKIIDILKETEGDSKNIFGQYSSKRLKDWQEIVNLYKKKNVYLAEAAELLINTVKYELPSIKKQIAKQNQLKEEWRKKESDAVKMGNSAKNELNSLLRELGLEGHRTGFRKALLTSAKQLYTINEDVAGRIKTILPAIEYYKLFTSYSQPKSEIDLALIKYLSNKGNTTTYEWEKGVKPTKVILPTLAAEESEQDDGTIDWGFDIDFSDSKQIENADLEEVKKDTIEENNDTEGNAIVAEGPLALSVLDNSIFRTNLINQLLEIQCFIKTRLYELEHGEGLNTIAESASDVKEMSSSINNVLNLLTNTTTENFYNILYYPRYLDDILKKIEAKENAIERGAAISLVAKEKAAEAEREVANLNQKVQVIVKKSRELQKEISEDISQRYNGREVNLMGGASVN
ncbi:CDK5 regulatory subunit-associated protein 3 isoform X1 [Cimex lectularius]|uniref:CDK5RAP3-like protein n=2 Tax=Cimex lectularius TaxID=79782 RepID=A0A8I6TMT5_CIMLE|nr:CDK5 regulatory subunit-associated protein 3 isoform X1 [Cimex lectularius]XP_024085240.1 CDK5 regulatory subunit-associated protein 3 isoform X1 [Cimex lectularius]XP_024085241.1 CDK5 regulatory subunit-associated protein 3 isoform X1 [Cimex lectularius]XP_024085242.1 CDK5 regulatory subunit-associated protein 3 isoform X1 [Cimex lectularius]